MTTPPSQHVHRPQTHRRYPLASALLCASLAAHSADTTPGQQLQRFSQAGAGVAQAEQGRLFFTTRHGGEWSCSSCHGAPPTQVGKHANTGKIIDPLAPAFNTQAFTTTAKVDKWFRRNCNDVLKRECTSAEKADVVAYLLSLKPQ
jgi:Domain of unknown function (DUF1924)